MAGTQYVPNRGNTIMPAAGAHLFKTYQVAAPIRTHFRKATCAEVGCEPYRHGWVSILPSDDPHVALLKQSGRRFVTYRDYLPVEIAARMPDFDPANPRPKELGPGLVAYWFEAGQVCFASDRHVVSLERPFLFVVRDGDWRGNPRGTAPRRHASGHDWADDMAEHLDRLPK